MSTIETAVVETQTEDASKEHAKTLAVVYRRLFAAVKAVKAAERAIKGAWVGAIDLSEARQTRFASIEKLDRIMDESWTVLTGLPKGTVAPGGATPQTVGLQFFNANLNRSLAKRMSAADARDANRRSFG